MSYSEYASNLERIKNLAERKQTGTPCLLAQKLGISERTVLRMIQQLRDHGYKIEFNRFRETYELKEP